MAATIGQASRDKALSGRNSPGLPCGPCRLPAAYLGAAEGGRLGTFPSRPGRGTQVRTEGRGARSPGCQGYQRTRSEPSGAKGLGVSPGLESDPSHLPAHTPAPSGGAGPGQPCRLLGTPGTRLSRCQGPPSYPPKWEVDSAGPSPWSSWSGTLLWLSLVPLGPG